MATVQAGASVVDITAPLGMAMGGYGARIGGATGVHDPLHVRTLVFDDGATTLAIAICDFVGVDRAIADSARRLIQDELGIPPENVCIAATHTHSGLLTVRTRDANDYFTATAAKIADSVRAARESMEPVSLKTATTGVGTVSQNRRHPDAPIETVVKVLLAAPDQVQTPARQGREKKAPGNCISNCPARHASRMPRITSGRHRHARGGEEGRLPVGCGYYTHPRRGGLRVAPYHARALACWWKAGEDARA